ncbi:5-methyltetrahydropteroyltriglutamate--homocysteine S-methyltransferase [Enterococcus devriesei]|uniref:5-methyltetrahydropteroyltriglutamate-- homocysteine S-methyltransferase n=1 Tax=Enterococcus TaxID=1350 RepID=UPI001C0FD5DA|nr:5-methyltetrahydropteroyltriglutamate--homocysteine S-methyltransferase [Enterococcus devriesei]MBU5365902.1 5-methyltetrahydropteroyltriglutamate--homocysteine S-methyltransferase [Enterococcus devriesei]MDT2822872.1 5-methyltetrahydropteroyltriglutamate--homocysteine S-methyltransferase [Enterococcus devriesei]
MTKRTTSPFRYDIVGSFLRPEKLKAARKDFEAGKLSQAELTAVEDEAIIALIEKQEAAGLKAVTDGEFRRSWWHLDFFWGLNGAAYKDATHGYHFDAEETRAETATLTGKLDGKNHPFVEHFKFVKTHAKDGSEVRQTIPAPAQFYKELLRPENQPEVLAVYPEKADLISDIVKAYQETINELYDAGLHVLQLDDCTWGMLVANLPEGVVTDGQSEEEVREVLKKELLDINNRVLAGLPEDLIVNTHVCRGNYHSTWSAAGGYDLVASPLFNQENVHAYYLEYDSDRAGGFAPLAKVSPDKLVVLGLVTSKTGELEERDAIITRINEAAEYIDLDRLALSPQCGFASTEEGNILTEEQQWNKIALIKSIAEEVWQEK